MPKLLKNKTNQDKIAIHRWVNTAQEAYNLQDYCQATMATMEVVYSEDLSMAQEVVVYLVSMLSISTRTLIRVMKMLK